VALARPGLLLAALLMVGLTTTLGVLVAQSMFNWLTMVNGYQSRSQLRFLRPVRWCPLIC